MVFWTQLPLEVDFLISVNFFNMIFKLDSLTRSLNLTVLKKKADSPDCERGELLLPFTIEADETKVGIAICHHSIEV